MLPSERVQTRAAIAIRCGGSWSPTNRHKNNHQLLLLLACLLLACHAVSESRQDEVQSNTNQHINISNQQETIKSGNTKTNNFNLQESNYQPTQSTQLVFNVGKYKNNSNKLRRSRPPTIDEFEIKKRIMNVYLDAADDFQAGARESLYFEHLGRILRALNPKYIATKRVAYVAFADPRDPDAAEQVAPEDELPRPTENVESDEDEPSARRQEPLVLRGDSELSLQEQLDLMGERVKATAVWDRDFVRKLFRVPDGAFTPNQLAYKRFLQCMTYPLFCKQQMIVKKKEDANDAEQLLPSPPPAAGDEYVDQSPAASEVQPQVVRMSQYSPNGGEAPREQQPVYEPRVPAQQPQEWRYQQPAPALKLPPPQTRFQQRWPQRPTGPQQQQQQPPQQQPPRRFKEQQQLNYKVANPDVNLPQKLVQQYAPEYQEQMQRMNRIRGGGQHRHHK